MFLTAETLPILVLAECVVELLACWSLRTVILWTLVKWLAVCYCPVSDIMEIKSCTYHYSGDGPH